MQPEDFIFCTAGIPITEDPTTMEFFADGPLLGIEKILMMQRIGRHGRLSVAVCCGNYIFALIGELSEFSHCYIQNRHSVRFTLRGVEEIPLTDDERSLLADYRLLKLL